VIPKDKRGQGFKGSSEIIVSYKELNLTKVKGKKITWDYVRILYISYGSVCELETQILLAGNLDFIEKGELATLKRYRKNRKNDKDTDKVFRI
jgi:hypothetical protein